MKKVVLLSSDDYMQLKLVEMFFEKMDFEVKKFFEHDNKIDLLSNGKNIKIDLIFISLGKIIHDYKRFFFYLMMNHY